MDTNDLTTIKKEWHIGFIHLLAKIEGSDQWIIPFFNTYNTENDYELDGDPVFSMIRYDKIKIIKIIHKEEEDEPNFIISNFDDIPMLVSVI